MKKIASLKLNQLSMAEMEKREMNLLKGGSQCGCGCHYSGSGGGSGTYDNGNYNYASGYHSYGGDVICSGSDGRWYASNK